MQTIYLIRHGQANFGGGAENYDQLSDLGKKQASLLADSFKLNLICPDVICTGTLKRHQETAHPVTNRFISAPIKVHEYAELNEFSISLWKKLALILKDSEPEFAKDLEALRIAQSLNQKKAVIYFFKVTNILMERWKSGLTPPDEESYKDFRARILGFKESLQEFKKEKHILVFSSGTPISILISSFLQMGSERELEWMYGLWNTSVSIFKGKHFTFKPITINSLPHIQNIEDKTIV
jgi:broad specificity phosphatase PhoE